MVETQEAIKSKPVKSHLMTVKMAHIESQMMRSMLNDVEIEETYEAAKNQFQPGAMPT